MKDQSQPLIEAGDIVKFYYQDASKHKYAVNIEVINIRKNSITGVVLTTKKADRIYPGDYLLPAGIMPKPTKAICDQPIKIYKEDVVTICGHVDDYTLREIRRRVAESLGII